MDARIHPDAQRLSTDDKVDSYALQRLPVFHVEHFFAGGRCCGARLGGS